MLGKALWQQASWVYLLDLLTRKLQHNMSKQLLELWYVKPLISYDKCNMFLTLGVIYIIRSHFISIFSFYLFEWHYLTLP